MIGHLKLLVLLWISFLGAVPKAHGATVHAAGADPVITIVYDDRSLRQGVRPDRGFACIVRRGGTTLLFDAGRDGDLLLHNLNALGWEPGQIHAAAISHLHSDHIGGLGSLLKREPGIAVHLPAAAPAFMRDRLQAKTVSVARAGRPTVIAPGIFTTGALGTSPPEQALALRSSKGLILVTGCAHPGIVRVVRHAREVMKEDVRLVVGGFHLRDKGRREIEAAIAGLKKLGVRHVAPCHCTGEEARALFRKGFGSGFIEAGAGTVMTIPPP